MTPNTILNLAELSLKNALRDQIYQISPTFVLYRSDENEVKKEQPYGIIHCEDAEETIGPGTGIYKIPTLVICRFHVKPETADDRDAIVTAINNFTYSDPRTVLSQLDGFHCYGFMPIAVRMEVNTELKSYEYINRFELICMPRNDS